MRTIVSNIAAIWYGAGRIIFLLLLLKIIIDNIIIMDFIISPIIFLKRGRLLGQSMKKCSVCLIVRLIIPEL